MVKKNKRSLGLFLNKKTTNNDITKPKMSFAKIKKSVAYRNIKMVNSFSSGRLNRLTIASLQKYTAAIYTIACPGGTYKGTLPNR